MSVLNANVRAYAKSPKWHKSYLVARTCICILFLAEE